ncbi:MAG: transporter, partial [Nitrosomonadaceae bacterium]
MNQTKKHILRCFLASTFAVYSNAVLAHHGSIGFGIGTASPIITQTGITLPKGKIATGLITEFIEFDNVSAGRLLAISGAAPSEPRSDVHSTKSRTIPSVFAAIGVTDDLTL